MPELFDNRKARRGIDGLGLAYDRWFDFQESEPLKPRRDREQVEKEAFAGAVLIVEVVRWVRTVDEYLSDVRERDNRGQAGYDDVLNRNPEMGATLDGIAHAADKSLHRLIDLSLAVYTPSLIRTSVYPDGRRVRRNDPRYIWMDLSGLPARNTPREQAKATGYAQQLARQEVRPVLRAAVEFLRSRRP